MELNFRTLTKDDVEVRVGTTKKDKAGNVLGVSLLLYKNARVDMAILDETVGPANWQRKHTELKDNIYCSVGIRMDHDEWVWKEDCGVCANDSDEVIRDKGEASDSLKRACFNWGIGRELYTAPFIWIDTNDKFTRYDVSEMEVSADHKITKLVIINAKTRSEVFKFDTKKQSKVASKSTLSAAPVPGTPTPSDAPIPGTPTPTPTSNETTAYLSKIAPISDELKEYLSKMSAAKTSAEVNAIWGSLTPEQQAMTEYKEPCVKKCKELKAA